jgi:phage baseplate assembly protein W
VPITADSLLKSQVNMAEQNFLGRDFHLGFVADEEGRVFAGPFSQVDLQPMLREDVAPRVVDLSVVSGKANLVQSLILRLKTERGELANLGHPDYGSRHHQLIGEPNTEGNRNLMKLYVLECLRQEPRLEAIQKIDVQPGQGRINRDKVDITMTVTMKGLPDPLSLIIPFSFAGPLE